MAEWDPNSSIKEAAAAAAVRIMELKELAEKEDADAAIGELNNHPRHEFKIYLSAGG